MQNGTFSQFSQFSCGIDVLVWSISFINFLPDHNYLSVIFFSSIQTRNTPGHSLVQSQTPPRSPSSFIIISPNKIHTKQAQFTIPWLTRITRAALGLSRASSVSSRGLWQSFKRNRAISPDCRQFFVDSPYCFFFISICPVFSTGSISGYLLDF